MKMADGGYRPAYNVGFAADTKSQVIVGLDVTPAGNDQGQLTPMVRQLQGRYGRAPDALLADAGYLKTAEIDELAAAACGTTLYLPPRIPADPTRDPYRPLPDDSPTVAAWRVSSSRSTRYGLRRGMQHPPLGEEHTENSDTTIRVCTYDVRYLDWSFEPC